MALNSTEEIVEDIRRGKMVILMDDEDRENEGDLIMAAEYVCASDINFMARYGRGLICLTLTSERCQKLRLPLMVDDNQAALATNFTVSIEAAEGVTTGISAADRAATVKAAVAEDATADDIVQPGHIFPLRAQPGGVLNRAGHTEAGCDLARLSGAEPAAVIVEILNEDGSMARMSDLLVFAREHDLKIGTIADLIQYRMDHEKTVELISECEFPTEYGHFRLHAFEDTLDGRIHIALIMGDLGGDDPVLVRVHMENALCDLFGSQRADCGYPLQAAMKRIAREGRGVVVVLRKPTTSRGLANQLHTYQLEDDGLDGSVGDQVWDVRSYGLGAQILSAIGIHTMRVLSSPKNVHGLSGFNLEIVEYVECD
ncbi:MAG TPA: 3,4-dihydroxy-2-butanone-4-phosphate synthase [Chromatiaceae bacterium]|jgi:3,4-dihydroxy 2-butanone 4-phosphate synthase/GTP cyclohydrolase II|nr:3,4-dihydroxy-2-butanone-4-phosphate synthase [Chromatiaceae bacterium]HIA07768.1 3,4-dihydroxy-2-butanone-4-phosphate synthase [Chromatiaceae bacterium]HIB84118.1 3,4-dihydroxy-2-butanone-4-phosphate synthase [Chromatiaceae bacterium]HIN82632.1 3,4-dihydroxy-2-butanone-4-phosphate synthase [Chromatiales bacterium]HIO54155.1 3,4-dihydroxy-2-butanone-4-phosphate synthase [Chromatiales bacterium]